MGLDREETSRYGPALFVTRKGRGRSGALPAISSLRTRTAACLRASNLEPAQSRLVVDMCGQYNSSDVYQLGVDNRTRPFVLVSNDITPVDLEDVKEGEIVL